MLGGCSDFAVLILKGFPKVFCSFPALRFPNPKWIKPCQQRQSPEQDLGLGPSSAAPSPLTAGTPIGHSNSTLTNGTTLTTTYSFYSTHFFLHYRDCQVHDVMLVTVPELNKKPHFSAVTASQLHSFSHKPFCLILQDLTHYLIMFSTLGNCWQHNISLQSAPQALAIHCLITLKACCEQLTWKPHCWNLTFFSLNVYKWVKKLSIH